MAQRSVVAQTTQPETYTTPIMYQWMRHFFTEGVSSATHPIIELERRACWVGLALVLQALNEIQAAWYLPYVRWLRPYVQLIPFFLILGSFIAMWQAFRPTSLKQQAQGMQKHPGRGLQILLVLALLATIVCTARTPPLASRLLYDQRAHVVFSLRR